MTGRSSAAPWGTYGAFAHAVADHRCGALLIGPDNKGMGPTSVSAAIRSGATFAVQVQSDIVAVDSDDERSAAALDAVADAVREAGHIPVIVASGGEGRHHLWARVPSRPNRNKIIQLVSDEADRVRERHDGEPLGDFVVRRGSLRIRPPLSPHRLGRAVRLVTPSSPQAALNALAGVSHADAAVLPTQFRPLPADIWTLVTDDDVQGRYGSRSDAQFAIVCSAVQRGWSAMQVWDALMNPSHVGGDRLRAKVHEHGEPLARVRFDVEYDKAAGWVIRHPPIRGAHEVRERVIALSALADKCTWSGTSGNTDRAVLAAVIAVALQLGSFEVRLSNRRLSEMTQTRPGTVGRSLRRLEPNWLRRLEPGTQGRGTFYRLTGPGKVTNPVTTSSTTGGVCTTGSFAYPAHDIFCRQGVGLGGWRVLNALHTMDAATATNVADDLGLTAQAVRGCLRKLRALGLAVQQGDGEWKLPLGELALNQAAERAGVAGHGDALRKRHDAERLAYHGVDGQRIGHLRYSGITRLPRK